MNIFGSIGAKAPKKSLFDLSHSRKFSFAPGKLYPTMCQETLPGDKWKFSSSAVVKFMPPLAPLMHLVDVFQYNFSVPMRLTMGPGNFETFITGGPKGDGKNALGENIQIPFIRVSNEPGYSKVNGFSAAYFQEDTLADYLGCNFANTTGESVVLINMMPFIAFWRVYCEYFRDQNLMDDYVSLHPGIFQSQGDITNAVVDAYDDVVGDQPWRMFDVPQVCWAKDMYTSALPFAQRGNPVETPLSGTATINYRDVALVTGAPAGTDTQALGVRDATNNVNRSSDGTFDSAGGDTGIDNIEDVELVSGGFTINALRVAARLQEWLEKMARGGARYIEQMWQMFHVRSSDARLQRSEYLSGGKIPVHISEVLQTSEEGATPQGNMAGHGLAAGKITFYNKFFEEHTILISVIFLRPQTAYQQGMPRLFTHRFDKLQWAWPTFAHLGEQEVANSEVFMTTDNASNDGTFGYQQRYAEYKYIPSTVHGQFKTSLDFWHWGRKFDTQPTLSPAFVLCDPSPRIFPVESGDPMYCIVQNQVTALRPLPYYGEPYL